MSDRAESLPSPSHPWYREPLLLVVVAAWAALFVARLTTLTLRGEETRRARVAYEMVETGDWIVSRQQGVPFADRPPFGEWMIAVSSFVCGEMTPTAVRLPAIFGVLAAAIWTFVYTRRFLSPLGALGSSLMFLTFGQVLQLGRLAETEGVFVGVLTTGLFGWHLAYRAGRPAWQTWMWGYFWGALAALAKGPQGAVYFAAPVVLYLLLRRDWRYLVSFSHAAGLAVFGLLFGGWWLAYLQATDLTTAKTVLFGLVEMRLANKGSLWVHMLAFPVQVGSCLLPWVVLLVRYFDRRLRADLGPARDAVLFCTAAIVATIPSLWFIIGTVSRHYFGMFACFAVLAGVVLDRSLTAAPESSLGKGWRLFQRSLCGAMVVCAVGVAVMPWIELDWARRLEQPPLFAAGFLCVALATVVLVVRSLRVPGSTPEAARARFLGFAGCAAFVGLLYVGVGVNVFGRMASDNAAQTAALKQSLPPGAKLVSFGPLEHQFTFFYRDPIALLPWPTAEAAPPTDFEYFAFTKGAADPTFSFAWEPVAVVSCERNHKAAPIRAVVVGRRLAAKSDEHVAEQNGSTQRR
jgi:4-amino-4-deoxy-L-arabinose transferase-like glycosyltransferase